MSQDILSPSPPCSASATGSPACSRGQGRGRRDSHKSGSRHCLGFKARCLHSASAYRIRHTAYRTPHTALYTPLTAHSYKHTGTHRHCLSYLHCTMASAWQQPVGAICTAAPVGIEFVIATGSAVACTRYAPARLKQSSSLIGSRPFTSLRPHRSQALEACMHSARTKNNLEPFLDLCVSSLRRGHANLLCIVPILTDVPEGTVFVVCSRYMSACALRPEVR